MKQRDNSLFSSCSLSKQPIHRRANKKLDQQQLNQRFTLILSTFLTQKQQFQQKYLQQINQLKLEQSSIQQLLTDVQQKNQKLQSQNRQLRFNYHQRGSVVDYVKKKIINMQQKFKNQKHQMISVIKYLQIKNTQLNQTIYQLKQTQIQNNKKIHQLQSDIYQLQQKIQIQMQIQLDKFVKYNKNTNCKVKYPQLNIKYCELTNNNISNNNFKYAQSIVYTQKMAKSYKNINEAHETHPPININNKIHKNIINNNNHYNTGNKFQYLNPKNDQFINQSLTQSTIKQKSTKLQKDFNRSKSYNKLDFSNINLNIQPLNYDSISHRKSSVNLNSVNNINNNLNNMNINNNMNNIDNLRYIQSNPLDERQILIKNYGYIVLSQFNKDDMVKRTRLKKIKNQKSKATIKISNLYCDVFNRNN